MSCAAIESSALPETTILKASRIDFLANLGDAVSVLPHGLATPEPCQ